MKRIGHSWAKVRCEGGTWVVDGFILGESTIRREYTGSNGSLQAFYAARLITAGKVPPKPVSVSVRPIVAVGRAA